MQETEPTQSPAPDEQASKAVLWSALLLAAFSLVAMSLVIITQRGTSERILQNQQAFLLASLAEVMPPDQFNNQLVNDSYLVNAPLLGPETVRVYPAYLNGKPNGAILTAVAPNGYNGKIKIILGLDYAGHIHAVRVLEHKETPGLGDPIEIKRSNWITQFRQRSLEDPELADWQVKKDGGQFDQLTGATITPRAVIKALSNALLYYNENRSSIFAQQEAGKNP
ncbi:MAG: electron transport complex subunit RsxG [Gammaproteobacteria bacterium]|nr:electron transport complex subunit RsxG [Gammaproteobacteria bacterium]